MEKIRVLIVDDERPARRALRTLLESESEIEIVGEATDGENGIEMIRKLRPHLAFLDVQMPMLTGLEMLNRLPAGERPEIIFVTAYDEFALRAFELQAIDYLVKPYSDQRFHMALDRAKRRIRAGTFGATEQALRALLEKLQSVPPAAAASASVPAPGSVDFSRLVVKADGQLHFLSQADIRWVEGQGDFVKLHLKDRGLMVRMTLTKVEEMLDPEIFVRIHKSTIVNLNCVRRVMPMLARSHGMELDDGTALPIGPSYRGVLDRLK
jgi:two-component system, LytTR family, response regulator